MPKYSLTPKHTENEAWNGSLKKTPIEIFAINETEARKKATLEYMQMTEIKSVVGNNPISPWENSDLCECIEITDD